MKRLILIICAFALTACASTDYQLYSKAQTDIAVAKSASEEARYKALAIIAKDGDGASKVAAVMALALGGGTQAQTTQIAAPQRSDALMWASILVPGITQAYAIGKSADVAINSSNNAMLTSTATTAGFVGIAGKIQAPAAANVIVPQANVSTVTSTVTSTDSHDTASTVSTATTLSGTGLIGDGSYSTQANPSTPIVVPDVIQIIPVVVPDTIQITPVIQPVAP